MCTFWNGDFETPVQYRFDILAERESRAQGECTNQNNITRQDFARCSLDDKMLHIFDELRFVRDEQVNCSRGMMYLHKTVQNMNDKMNQVIETTNTQTDFLKTLAYKSVDTEARSRRNNLIFRGLAENYGENCTQLILDFLKNHLDIDPHNVYISRAHRTRQRNPRRNVQSRPIIVNFRDYGVIDKIMANVRRLRGTGFSVDRDYPPEINEARSRLWPIYKDLKSQNPRDRVHIVFPAKLIHNGSVVKDELPEWGKYIGTNRLTQVYQIANIKRQPFLKESGTTSGASAKLTSVPMATGQACQQVDTHSMSVTGATALDFQPVDTQTMPVSMETTHSFQQTNAQAEPSSDQPRTSHTEEILPASTEKSLVKKPLAQENAKPPTVGAQHVESTSTISPCLQNNATNCVLPTVNSFSVCADVNVIQKSQSKCGESFSDSNVSTEINNTIQQQNFSNAVSCREIGKNFDNSNLMCSDETTVKTIQSDESNPLLSSEFCKRGRSRVTKAAARSEKRSASAVPYKRNTGSASRSRSRVNTNRVLPSAKNSTNAENSSVSGVDSNAVTSTAERIDPGSTGQPPTQSEAVKN